MSIRKTAYYGAHRLIGSSLGHDYEACLKEDATGLARDTVEQSLTRLLNHCKRNIPQAAW